MIGLAGACAQVSKTRQLAVHHDPAVVQMHRAGKAAYATGRSRHLRFICESNRVFRNIQCVDQLRHVQLTVAAEEHSHIALFVSFCIIGHEEQRFDRLFLVQLEERRDLVDRLCARCMHLFQRQHSGILLRRSVHASRLFDRCRQIAAVAVSDLGLAVFAERRKLVRIGAADRTGIRLDRPEVQTAARKYIAIGFIHFVIAFVQPCRVLIKGVVILHNENT